MAKFAYFNDTGREVNIHPSTWFHVGSTSTEPIKNLETRVFTYPEGEIPLIKQWGNGTIIVMLFSEHFIDFLGK